MLDELKKHFKESEDFKVKAEAYLKPANNFRKKAAPYMFDWVLNTPLEILKFSR